MKPAELIGSLPGGRVLDVATGSGGFVHFLLEGLRAYTEILGVDISSRGEATFEEAFRARPNVRFQRMDALNLEFKDSSFDLVSIANSLHHFDDPAAVLREMLRVLRPGGTLLLFEMYRDGQTETQLTHVQLHHWWAAVDRAHGIVHHETYTRDQLLGLLAPLSLTGLTLHDLSALDEDPHHPTVMRDLALVFERYLQRAEGHPDLQERGRELRRRVEQVGFHSATSLLAFGCKP